MKRAIFFLIFSILFLSFVKTSSSQTYNFDQLEQLSEQNSDLLSPFVPGTHGPLTATETTLKPDYTEVVLSVFGTTMFRSDKKDITSYNPGPYISVWIEWGKINDSLYILHIQPVSWCERKIYLFNSNQRDYSRLHFDGNISKVFTDGNNIIFDHVTEGRPEYENSCQHYSVVQPGENIHDIAIISFQKRTISQTDPVNRLK